MKEARRPPSLLPLIRTATQGSLLAWLLLHPDDEFSLTELAKRVGTSLPTVTREVDRAVASGLAKTRTVGRARLVSANTESPLYAPMATVMEVTFGPSALLSEQLSGIPGVEDAYVFGSWARRYRGEIGKPPRDLDVLVIGAPNRDEVYEAARRVERRVGLPVQVTFRSREQWNRTADAFLETVKDGALIQVPLQ